MRQRQQLVGYPFQGEQDVNNALQSIRHKATPDMPAVCRPRATLGKLWVHYTPIGTLDTVASNGDSDVFIMYGTEHNYTVTKLAQQLTGRYFYGDDEEEFTDTANLEALYNKMRRERRVKEVV